MTGVVAILVVCVSCGFRPMLTADALGDGVPSDAAQPPQFVTSAAAHKPTADGLMYQLTIPSVSRGFLLVSVGVGANSGDPAGTATVMNVRYGTDDLAPIATILGAGLDPTNTRSEHWGLVAPPAGNQNVVVTLSRQAKSIHSIAIVVSGVDQTTPVRNHATASGTAMSSSVDVASSPQDLVINTVGQGRSIDMPGAGQTERELQNVSGSYTLDNSAASTAPGAATVTMTWTFATDDEFQTISSSIRP